MTVSKTHNRKDYVAGAPPNNKTYAFDFKIYDEADLLVYVNGVLKILNTDYTVSGGPTWTESGGNIVFVASLVAADAVLVYRDLTVTQGTHWPEGDPFPSASHENAADRLVMLAQQFSEAIGRVFKVVVSSLLTNIEVPEGAGKLWGWNALGTGAALYNQIIDTGVITTKGDMIYGETAGIPARKPIGADGDIQRVASGIPDWEAPTSFKLDDWGIPDDNTDLDVSDTKHGLFPKFIDNTTLDVSIAKHGLCPKLPNNAEKYFDGIGGYTIPSKLKLLATGVNKISWTAAQTWADVDISADTGTDTAKFAYIAWELAFSCVTDSVWANMTGLVRKNGSGETNLLPKIKGAALYVTAGFGTYCKCNAAGIAMVECDGSEKFEVQLQTDSGTPSSIVFKLHLLGYGV